MRFIYKYLCLLAFTFILGSLPIMLSAQNNLKVNIKDAASVPNNLNVCGDADTVTVTVSTEGLASAIRQNIQAKLNLFKGVELVKFVPSGSSPGVVMTDSSDLTSPVFALPDLAPNFVSSVDIQYIIRVNCDYTDTLSKNDQLEVLDRWDFLYDLGVTVFGVTESDFSTEYRDPIKVPFFTMSVNNNAPSGARVGQCYQRTTLINNSGLDGFVKGFIYTNSQGPGVSVKSITVNGIVFPFTKNPSFNATGDSLIAMIIPDSIFKYNTRGVSGPADGDSLFEPDETVTIIEEICIANCDLSRISTHEMSWGCDARYCNTIKRQDLVKLGQGSVNVSFQSSGSVANVVGGYCANGSQTVTFTNTGVEVDAGTGTMYDVSAGIGLSDSLKARYAGYRISSIKIGGVNIPTFTNPIIDIKDNPLFATDPDGAGGLEDIDNDGFFDDLAINNKLEVTVEYEVECSVSLSNKEDFCTNDFETGFNARLDYTNSCQTRTSYLQPRFFSPVNSSDYIENCVDPDARTDGKTFFIESSQIRNVFNFERDCSGQEVIQVAIKLPQGVSAIRDSMSMRWFEVNMPLLTFNTSNDTVFMTFSADSSHAQFLNGEYHSRFGFSADCTALPGSTAFPIETAFYCPPCDCRHVWYCDTITGPRLHYASPPCVPNVAYDCANGVQTVDFKVERTTFGFLDDTYTTSLKAEEVNTKVALSCDSVKMTVLNIVGNTAISDSIGVLISYDNISSNDSNRINDIFTFKNAQIKITHGGNTYNCSIDTSKMRAVRTDTTKAMYFDLHSCLVGLGIGPLSKGDSINFIGNFAVNPEGPYKYTFEKVPNFRAFGYHVEADSLYTCDNYGALFRVGKSQALFSYPSSSNFPVGCSEASLEYKITMFNNDFYKYFGQEFRQAVGVDSIAFDYDPNFVKAFTTKVEISIADHPVYGNAYFPLANLDSTGKYRASFDTLTAVPSLNLLTSYAFNLRIKATPNCATVTGSMNGDSVFYFKPTIYYRDRYYAKVIGDGSCSPYLKDTATVTNQKIVYKYPASLEFSPVTNPSITTANDTAQWDVKLCNTNEKGSATNSWISIAPNQSGKNFKVISITDITNNLTPINHQVKYYPTDSTKAFAFLNGLAEATVEKTIDDVCNVVRIKAIIRECGTTDLKFKTGWLCALPSSPTWTPTEYAPCADSVINAQVRTENPFLDANFINQNITVKPGICDTTTLEILLRNTDIGIAYDVKTRLTIPLQGATLIPGSIEVAYPSGSAYKPALGVPTSVGQTQKGKTYEFSDFALLNTFLHQKGLKGFNALNPNDSNEVKIKLKFTNDCDFKSGSLSYFTFQGKTICGTASNFESGESVPIEIQGATLTVPKSYEVENGTNNQFVAGGYSTIEVKFKNLLTTPSDTADEVGVKLPLGIKYKPNTSVAVAPATWIPGEPRITYVGDIQILTWFQPLNLLQNEQAVLKFDVNASDTLSCGGTLDMALATLAAKDLLCATNASVCKTELITTSNGEHYYPIPLNTGNISVVSNMNITSSTIYAKTGDTVIIAGTGAQQYQWINADNGLVLDTDSLIVIVPTQPELNVMIMSSLPSGCIIPTSIKILLDSLAPDTIPPVFVPKDTLLIGKTNGDTLKINSCSNQTYFYVNSVEVMDNADPSPTVTFDSTVVNGNCLVDGYLTLKSYTWTGRDNLGNTSTYKIFVKISDSTPPVLIGVPNDLIISVLDTIPNANVTATDNCIGATVTPNLAFTRLNGTDSVFTRNWIAVDSCGNAVRDTQLITKRGYSTPSVSERKDTVYVGDTLKYCLSNLGLTGTINKVINTCTTTSNRNVTYTVDASNCLVMVGKTVGVDTACLTICTDSSYCVQVKFITESLTKKPDTIKVTTVIGKSDTVCLLKRGLKGNTFTVKNICPDSLNAAVEYTITGTCIIIKGMYGGSTKSCWVVCDSLNTCDTTIIDITVNPLIINRIDTVYVGDSTKYCLSNINYKGKIISVTNTCPTTSNRNVKYTVDASNCIVMTGQKVGIDTACFTICTDSLVCVKVNFTTQSLIKKPDTIKVTTVIGKSDTVCLSKRGLKGNTFTVKNICPDSLNAAVEYTITGTCIIIKGMYGGSTKSCWVVCDSLNTCDTTIIDITVNPLIINRIDTIYVGDSTKYCFNNLNLKGKIISAVNGCQSTSSRFTDISIDSTNCIHIEGISVGVDTACFTICTDSLVCGKVNFYTYVLNRPLDTIKVNILKGKNDTVCLTTKRLSGNKYTLTNICADSSNTSVGYEKLSDTCIIIKGLNVGSNKSCWVLCDTLGKCDTTIIFTTVTDPSVIRVKDTLLIGDSLKFCFTQFNFKGAISSVVNNCALSSNRNVTYTVDDAKCIVLKGIRIGIDTACFDVCTDSLECKTVIFETTVLPRNRTINNTIIVGKSDTICISFNRPRNTPIINACADTTNKAVEYSVNDTCIVMKGVQAGSKKSCWVICDTLGVCDTITINTKVTEPNPIISVDTIQVGDSIKICLSQLNFKGRINMVTNNCASTSNRNVTYIVDDGNCIILKGIRIGTDTACFEVCTDSLDCRKVIFYTTVKSKYDTLRRTINIGKSDTVCLSINRPRGGKIANYCLNPLDTVVDFQTLNDTCVLIKGKTLGSSKSCWTICDTLGVCDTLVIVVTVADKLLPIATDDSIKVKRNTIIDIPIMKNDTVNGTFKRITLMTEPKYGTGVFEKDTAGNWIFRYTPKPDFCSSKYYDEFVYQLCNENGCDLGDVKVHIKCDTIIVYNGFSPNGDGKNDFFVVEGIEDYPNTNVIIYNRWGNKLYENKDYKNDWGGTWYDKAVPDGTYFYQVILETGEIYSGYVQIHH